MKIIYLPELHLSLEQPVGRLDDATETLFGKLKYVFDYAKKEKAIVVSAGDFFDRPRSWFLLPRIIEFLREYSTVKVYAVFGQHDTYMYHESTRHATSLGSLEKAGLVCILGSDPCSFNDWDVCIYGCNWGEDIPKVKVKSNRDILVIHAPISDKALWYGHDFISAKMFLKKHKEFDTIHCGDIHRQFFIEDKGRHILNAGPLCRREATEYNFTHIPIYFIENDEGILSKVIPHKPSDEVLSRDHIESAESNNLMLQEFIDSMPLRDEIGGKNDVSFRDNLEAFIKSNKIDKEVVRLMSIEMGE